MNGLQFDRITRIAVDLDDFINVPQMNIVSANGALRKANQVKHKVACTDISSLKRVTGEGREGQDCSLR